MRFEWIAALRFLADGRLQTLCILGGVSVGVGVIVFMSAMLAGLQANFLKRVLTSQPQIQLLPLQSVPRPLRGGPQEVEAAVVQRPAQRLLSIDQWQAIRRAVTARPDIVTAAPTVTGAALAIRGEASRSVSLVGMETEQYFAIVPIPSYIVAGAARLGTDDILIGTELARDLGAGIGDRLNLAAAGGRSRVVTVTGIFDLGSKGANLRTVYVGLRMAQSLLNLAGGATAIDLTVADVYAAERIAIDIAAALPVDAESWIRTNAQFFTAVQAQQQTNTLIRLFVGLSVAFGIASVLVVSVIQRSKDIGILRAMGCGRGRILRIFLIQGGVLGCIGSVAGAALGAAAVVGWHGYARQLDGSELFPLVLQPGLFVTATLLATLTGVAAAAAPALRAARLDPVAAIRG